MRIAASVTTFSAALSLPSARPLRAKLPLAFALHAGLKSQAKFTTFLLVIVLPVEENWGGGGDL
jgi:hypothetical protein